MSPELEQIRGHLLRMFALMEDAADLHPLQIEDLAAICEIVGIDPNEMPTEGRALIRQYGQPDIQVELSKRIAAAAARLDDLRRSEAARPSDLVSRRGGI